jgi:hypothetical protein
VNETGFTGIFWAMAAAMGIGVIAGIGGLVYLVASPGRRRQEKRAFPLEQVELLKRTASAIGGVAIDLPEKYKVAFLRAERGDVRLAVVLMPVDDDGAYLVQIESPVAGRTFVEAWPVGSPHQPMRVTSGLPEIKTGDPSFDPAYLVRADDEAHARAVLTREFRQLLGRMRALGGGGLVRFDLHPHKAVFQKEEAVADAVQLGELARLAFEAVKDLKGSLSTQAGMEFYDYAPKVVIKAQCPICGGPIAQGKVSCRRCGTPHHEECWKYFGACSMYACGERSFELA